MNAFRNDEGHYVWDNVKLPSATTILGTIGNPSLYQWYARMAAEECAALISRAENDTENWEGYAAQIKDVNDRANAAIRYRDHKGFIGSMTHHAVYRFALGDRDFSDDALSAMAEEVLMKDRDREIPENWESYRGQVCRESRHYIESAFSWIRDGRVEFESIGQEATVVSLTHGYAGTQDAVIVRAGKRYRVDFKTSNVLDQKKVQFQLEAYENADFIGVLATGERYDNPPSDFLMAVHITPMDGCKEYVWEPNEAVFEGFLCARQIYGLVNNMPKPNTKRKATGRKVVPVRERTCPF